MVSKIYCMYLYGKNIYEDEADKELYTAAENLLKAVGIPSNYNGFYYIMEASVVLVKEAHKRLNVTTLYKIVAKKYDRTVSLVEGGIKYAISKACETKNHDMLNNLLAGYTSRERETPTNMQFLRAVADYLKNFLR